ncbi:MAG: hypothetical protein AAF720_13265 [Pseudomonadota bacterium]
MCYRPMPPDIETVTEAWLQSRGVKLVPISPGEQRAAQQRLSRFGDPAKRKALRMVALWSLAPIAMAIKPRLSVKDMADFIGAEGYALEDHEGERTLVPEEICS